MGLGFRQPVNFPYSFHSLLSLTELTIHSIQPQIQVDSIKLRELDWYLQILIWSNFFRWASFVLFTLFNGITFHCRLALFKHALSPYIHIALSWASIISFDDTKTLWGLMGVYHILFSDKDLIVGKLSEFTVPLAELTQTQVNPRLVLSVYSAWCTPSGERGWPFWCPTTQRPKVDSAQIPALCLGPNMLMTFQKSSNGFPSFCIFWIKSEWIRQKGI